MPAIGKFLTNRNPQTRLFRLMPHLKRWFITIITTKNKKATGMIRKARLM
jgi:hypothetical protein